MALWKRSRSELITNTITGAVAIATLGNAPQASGRLSPIAAPGNFEPGYYNSCHMSGRTIFQGLSEKLEQM